MQVVKKHYFPALAEYIRHGEGTALINANALDEQLKGVEPEKILSVHEECLQYLAVNADSKEIVELYNRSFIFLLELMGRSDMTLMRKKEMDDKVIASQNRINEIEQLLYHSNQSTEKVKNKYENVLQHMDSGIALFDSKGKLSFVNVQMAKLLEIPREALIGKSIKEILMYPDVSVKARKIIIQLFREMVIKQNRYYEFQHSAGKYLLATLTYGEQLDGEFLLSIKDVSEFREIEQSAMQNDKLAMLGKIAAAIAHEIRNPLTSIRGFIQLLRPYLIEVGKEEYGRIILTEIDRANDIIYEFLNSSKPTAPMKQIALIDSLIKEAVMLIESEALLQNCEIFIRQNAVNLQVSIDVKQLKQVILNMIKNALDAVYNVKDVRQGKIEIILNSDGINAEIKIRDNGNGIDQLTMSKLFDPFFTTKQAGTGLGLSVSYRILRNHGGTIRVNSEEGKCTEFVIYLPLLT